jgi:hypothetical protein
VCLPPGLYNLVSKAFTVVATVFSYFCEQIKLLFIQRTKKSVWRSPTPNPQTPKIPSVKLHGIEDRLKLPSNLLIDDPNPLTSIKAIDILKFINSQQP